jgi:hypothetical protein
MKTPADDTPLQNDQTVTLRHAEHLMVKAFENVARHMEAISKELLYESNVRRNKVKLAKKDELTPQEKDALVREANLLEGRHQGLRMISIPIIVSACEMIAKEETS